MRLYFLLGLFIFVCYLQGENSLPSLGVPPFQEKNATGKGKDVALLISKAISPQKYQLKERIKLTPLLQEKLLDPNFSDFQDQQLQVDYLLVGEIAQRQNAYFVDYRLLDMSGNVVLIQETITAPSWIWLKAKLVESLINNSLSAIIPGYARVYIEWPSTANDKNKPVIYLREEGDSKAVRIYNTSIIAKGLYYVTVKPWSYTSDGKIICTLQDQELKITIYSSYAVYGWFLLLVGVITIVILKMYSWSKNRTLKTGQRILSKLQLELKLLLSHLANWNEVCPEADKTDLYTITKGVNLASLQLQSFSQIQISQINSCKSIHKSLRSIAKINVNKLKTQQTLITLQNEIKILRISLENITD